MLTEEMVQSDILAEFGDGTGGTFFHNRNDIGQPRYNALSRFITRPRSLVIVK
jgi:hypothetical protein